MEHTEIRIDSWLSIIDDIGIEKGDMLYISSELLMLMWLCKKKGEKFDANLLLDRLIEKVGQEGTILIPTYNFDFSNYGYYDRKNSKSKVGFLGNVALERSDFTRTRHPMHSFAVWGKYQKELVEMDNSNSFGEGTPFSFMMDKGAKEIGIGIDDCKKACTFIHHVEVKANVPYRFIKTFQGKYTDLDGIERDFECDYSARDLSIQYSFQSEGAWKIMSENGAAKRWIKDGVPIYSISMKKAYPGLFYEIAENKMRNMMKFSVDRDWLFGDKYEVCRK